MKKTKKYWKKQAKMYRKAWGELSGLRLTLWKLLGSDPDHDIRFGGYFTSDPNQFTDADFMGHWNGKTWESQIQRGGKR